MSGAIQAARWDVALDPPLYSFPALSCAGSSPLVCPHAGPPSPNAGACWVQAFVVGASGEEALCLT